MAFDFKKVFSSIKKVSHELPNRVVGIDFGSSSVKVVEIESREGVLTLATYGELQLGPYGETGMGSSVKLPLQKKIEAIVDVMRETGITSKDAVFSLQVADSFVTIISLNAKENEDISPRVTVEARKYIPVPISDVALEWSELIDLSDEKSLTREVLLAAIRNEALADTKSILDSLGMISRPSEIEIFSTLRAINKEQDTSLAIIDLGASTSKLYIAESGALHRIHRVQAGGAFATKTLAEQSGVSFEEAENLKRNYTKESPQAPLIKKNVENTFERTFQEFKRVLDQYELRTGTPIARIVLTGGSACFPESTAYASYVFNREVELTNPFAKVAYPAFMEDTLLQIAPTFTVALGAALRPFEQ